jgi:predicted dehydrogenase
VIDIGVHSLDFVNFLLGRPRVQRVFGTTRDAIDIDQYAYMDMYGEAGEIHRSSVEDSASALVRYEDDRTASYEIAWAGNDPTDHRYVVRGTEGAGELDIWNRSLEFFGAGDRGDDHLIDRSIESAPQPSINEAQMDVFEEYIATGDWGRLATVRDGLEAQRLVDAIYRSDESVEAVELGGVQ